MVLLIIMIIMLIILASCSSVDHGTVIDKLYSPEHRSYAPIAITVNKGGIMLIPRWIHHSESWKILVENDDDEEWWSVTKEYFDSVNVGDFVDRRKENAQ